MLVVLLRIHFYRVWSSLGVMNYPHIVKKKAARKQSTLVFILENCAQYLMIQRPKTGELIFSGQELGLFH